MPLVSKKFPGLNYKRRPDDTPWFTYKRQKFPKTQATIEEIIPGKIKKYNEQPNITKLLTQATIEEIIPGKIKKYNEQPNITKLLTQATLEEMDEQI